jgi:hypothetical protein
VSDSFCSSSKNLASRSFRPLRSHFRSVARRQNNYDMQNHAVLTENDLTASSQQLTLAAEAPNAANQQQLSPRSLARESARHQKLSFTAP